MKNKSGLIFAILIFLIMISIPIWYHTSVLYKTSFVGEMRLNLPESTKSYENRTIKVSIYNLNPTELGNHHTGEIVTTKGVWNISGDTYEIITGDKNNQEFINTIEIPYSQEIYIRITPLDLKYNVYIRK